MPLVRPVARLLLAGIFIAGGVDVLRNPEPRAHLAKPVIEKVAAAAPALPHDPVEAVRLNAFAQLIGGSMLALGILPRVAALGLAASLVPTTLGGHRFWELDDPAQRAQQRAHFLKNAGLLGGLLLLAMD